MITETPVLRCKLKKYERKSKKKSADGKEQVTRRYMIPIKKDQVEGTKFEDIEDIVILSNEDFEYELQKSKNASLLIKELESSMNGMISDIQHLKDTEIELDNVKSKLYSIKEKHDNALDELKFKNIEIMGVNNKYNTLLNENKELRRELKRLTDLRTLEQESLRIKANEIDVARNEYEELKKSHELLWNVVHKKDITIKELEEKGRVGNFFKRIIKKEE